MGYQPLGSKIADNHVFYVLYCFLLCFFSSKLFWGHVPPKIGLALIIFGKKQTIENNREHRKYIVSNFAAQQLVTHLLPGYPLKHNFMQICPKVCPLNKEGASFKVTCLWANPLCRVQHVCSHYIIRDSNFHFMFALKC